MSGGWRGAWNPHDRRPELVPESVDGNWAQAVAVFPSMASLSIAVATVDRPESVCLDDVPIIDRMPDASNVFIATGWSGHGWAIAPAVARLLANWVLDGSRPQLLKPFRLKRFSHGQHSNWYARDS